MQIIPWLIQVQFLCQIFKGIFILEKFFKPIALHIFIQCNQKITVDLIFNKQSSQSMLNLFELQKKKSLPQNFSEKEKNSSLRDLQFTSLEGIVHSLDGDELRKSSVALPYSKLCNVSSNTISSEFQNKKPSKGK